MEKTRQHKTICCFKEGDADWIIFILFLYYYVFNLFPRQCLIGKDEIVFWSLTLSQCKKSSVKAVTASSGFGLHLEITSRQNSFPSSGWGERGDGRPGKEKSRPQGKKGGKKREQVANTHTQLFLDVILGKIIKVSLYCIVACRQCAFKVFFKVFIFILNLFCNQLEPKLKARENNQKVYGGLLGVSIWYEGLFLGFLWKEWGNVALAFHTLLNASFHQVCYRFVLVKDCLDWVPLVILRTFCHNTFPSPNKINTKDPIHYGLKRLNAIRRMAWVKGFCYSGMDTWMCRYVDTSTQQLNWFIELHLR